MHTTFDARNDNWLHYRSLSTITTSQFHQKVPISRFFQFFELFCSDSIPLETPRFRPVVKSESGEPINDTEMEDLSDASFIKRHAKSGIISFSASIFFPSIKYLKKLSTNYPFQKLEVRERNLVLSDKRQQLETKKKLSRERTTKNSNGKKGVDELYR